MWTEFFWLQNNIKAINHCDKFIKKILNVDLLDLTWLWYAKEHKFIIINSFFLITIIYIKKKLTKNYNYLKFLIIFRMSSTTNFEPCNDRWLLS